MQELEQIRIGQHADDGTGDALRDGMSKVNDNFAKVKQGVDAVESTAANAAEVAAAAKAKADGDIPSAEKGMAGGVAPLDDQGKVPAAHLPPLTDYLPADEKGAPGGVAPLDEQGKVPAVNLPATADAIPLSQKGVAGGVAPLDDAGKVPAAHLPALEGDYVPMAQKGAAGGVAPLDNRGTVPAGNSNLPTIKALPDGTSLNRYVGNEDYFINTQAPPPDAPPEWRGRGLLKARHHSGGTTFQELTQGTADSGRWWRVGFGSGTWGEWRKILAEGNSYGYELLKSWNVDANELADQNTVYAWATQDTPGANFPSIIGPGFMRVTIMSSGLAAQELHVPVANQKPWIFYRTGNPEWPGVWQPWRVISSISNAAKMPDWDAGDIYVDGAGWYRWNGTGYALSADVAALAAEVAQLKASIQTLHAQTAAFFTPFTVQSKPA